MVSFRSSQSGRLRPPASSASPLCFAEPQFGRRREDREAREGRDGPRQSGRGDGIAAAPPPAEASQQDVEQDSQERGGSPIARLDSAAGLSAFVEALLDGTADRFKALAAAALAEAGDLHRFEDTHLAPAARRLGELWLSDECDFLAVTVAVARLERLFMGLALETGVSRSSDTAPRVLLAPAPGNQHSFGLTLVEERFRHAGWTVRCCGVGDGSEMLRLVAVNRYDVIGLSVHSGALLRELAATIARLRRTSSNRAAVILGGGSLALENARLLLDAGFDCLAEDAASAVRQAEAAVVSRAEPAYRAAAE